MKKRKTIVFKARELPDAELEKLLHKTGKLINTLRQGSISIELFASQTKISRSNISKYEAGGDMMLSSFLKVLRGLDITGEAFFKALKK